MLLCTLVEDECVIGFTNLVTQSLNGFSPAGHRVCANQPSDAVAIILLKKFFNNTTNIVNEYWRV